MRYADPQLEDFEAAEAVVIPPRLRAFLKERGAGKYGSIDIYELENIRDVYEEFFDDASEIFRVYLPFGCDNKSQELLVLRVAGEPQYARIWHETVPDDWPEEEWQAFDDASDPGLESIGM